jgi:hypothetical protein
VGNHESYLSILPIALINNKIMLMIRPFKGLAGRLWLFLETTCKLGKLPYLGVSCKCKLNCMVCKRHVLKNTRNILF